MTSDIMQAPFKCLIPGCAECGDKNKPDETVIANKRQYCEECYPGYYHKLYPMDNGKSIRTCVECADYELCKDTGAHLSVNNARINFTTKSNLNLNNSLRAKLEDKTDLIVSFSNIGESNCTLQHGNGTCIACIKTHKLNASDECEAIAQMQDATYGGVVLLVFTVIIAVGGFLAYKFLIGPVSSLRMERKQGSLSFGSTKIPNLANSSSGGPRRVGNARPADNARSQRDDSYAEYSYSDYSYSYSDDDAYDRSFESRGNPGQFSLPRGSVPLR